MTKTTDKATYAIDFGAVPLGLESAGLVSLTNVGVYPLVILSAGEPTDPEFGLTLNSAIEIPSGTIAEVPVTFKPFSAGGKSATVVIQTDSLSTPTVTLNLGGLGVMGSLTAVPPAVDFGAVEAHSSATHSVLINNAYPVDLKLTVEALPSPAAPVFSLDVSSGTQFTIPALGSHTIVVDYSPVYPSVGDMASFTLFSSLGPSLTVGLQGSAR